MPRCAGDHGGQFHPALVPHKWLHVGRLANNGNGGTKVNRIKESRQLRCAEETGFLVKAQRHMQRHRQAVSLCHDLWQAGQNDGDKPLHVNSAATMKPPAITPQGKRITGPAVGAGRHHIHMAGQQHSARAMRTCAGQQIETLAIFMCIAHAPHSKITQARFDIADDRIIRLQADAGKCHQISQNFDSQIECRMCWRWRCHFGHVSIR